MKRTLTCVCLGAMFSLLAACSKPAKLIGSWQGQPGKEIITFRPDGTFEAQVKASKNQGSWHLVDGNKLIVEGSGTSDTVRFEFAGNDLILTNTTTNRAIRYTRSSDGEAKGTASTVQADLANVDVEIQNALKGLYDAAQERFSKTGSSVTTYAELDENFEIVVVQGMNLHGVDYTHLTIRKGEPIEFDYKGKHYVFPKK